MNRKHTLFQRIIACAAVLLTCATYAVAQVSFGGLPASFEASSAQLRSELAPNVVKINPDFNPDDLISKNQWAPNEMHTKPLMVGKVITTQIDFAKQAKRTQLADGRIVYRLRIDTKGAKGLYLTYKDFFIPQDGGQLFIYSPDRKTVLGSYTYDTNPEGGEFATEPIAGNSLIMEYVCPIGNEVMPRLQIDGMAYIFRNGVIANQPEDMQPRRFNDPGEDNAENPECVVNVNCPDGNEWQTEKTGVTQMLMEFATSNGPSIALCSGNLLNNTNQDFTPYILSAAHCASQSKKIEMSKVHFNKWIFSFHYEKPGCSSAGFAGTRVKTMVGCRPKAFCPIKGQSDGLLLELNKKIPVAYRVFYNGWDRTKKLPQSVAGIHHPAGDAKKISLSNGPFRFTTWNYNVGGSNDHLVFTFNNRSNTEGGSSGSSLWNQDHLVIATLSGGTPGCTGSNLYGTLASHWNKYAKTPDYDGGVKSHMDIFLDPKGKGTAEKLQGTWRENAKSLVAVKNVKVTADKEKKNVIVRWTPIDKSQYPSHWKIKYIIYRNGMRLKNKDTEAPIFTESFEEAGLNEDGAAVYYGVQARYLYNGDKIPDDGYNNGKEYVFDDSDIVTNGFINAGFVQNVTPEIKGASQGVSLSWPAPVNLQEISNFGYPENIESKLTNALLPQSIDLTNPEKPKRGVRTAVASKFHVEGFGNDSKVYLYAVNIIPTSKSEKNYRIFALSGNNKGSNVFGQNFTIPDDYKEGTWLTVYLDKPFKINPKAATFIGVSSPNKKNSNGLKLIQMPFSKIESGYREFKITGDNGISFLDCSSYGSLYNYDTKGYLAIRPLFSSTASKAKNKEDMKVVSHSDYSVPFPAIKGYNVYRNDQKINKELVAYNLFSDNEGSTSDKYRIEVVYDDEYFLNNMEVDAQSVPRIYPTRLPADGTMNIEHADQVRQLSIFAMDGSLIKQIAAPQASLSLYDLPEGTYIVVMETAIQKITEKIYR